MKGLTLLLSLLTSIQLWSSDPSGNCPEDFSWNAEKAYCYTTKNKCPKEPKHIKIKEDGKTICIPAEIDFDTFEVSAGLVKPLGLRVDVFTPTDDCAPYLEDGDIQKYGQCVLHYSGLDVELKEFKPLDCLDCTVKEAPLTTIDFDATSVAGMEVTPNKGLIDRLIPNSVQNDKVCSLCLGVDFSGSMSDDIKDVYNRLDKLSNKMQKTCPLGHEIYLVDFTEEIRITHSPMSIERAIKKVRSTGLHGGREYINGAISACLGHFQEKPGMKNKHKEIIIMSDEYEDSHPTEYTVDKIFTLLSKEQVNLRFANSAMSENAPSTYPPKNLDDFRLINKMNQGHRDFTSVDLLYYASWSRIYKNAGSPMDTQLVSSILTAGNTEEKELAKGHFKQLSISEKLKIILNLLQSSDARSQQTGQDLLNELTQSENLTKQLENADSSDYLTLTQIIVYLDDENKKLLSSFIEDLLRNDQSYAKTLSAYLVALGQDPQNFNIENMEKLLMSQIESSDLKEALEVSDLLEIKGLQLSEKITLIVNEKFKMANDEDILSAIKNISNNAYKQYRELFIQQDKNPQLAFYLHIRDQLAGVKPLKNHPLAINWNEVTDRQKRMAIQVARDTQNENILTDLKQYPMKDKYEIASTIYILGEGYQLEAMDLGVFGKDWPASLKLLGRKKLRDTYYALDSKQRIEFLKGYFESDEKANRGELEFFLSRMKKNFDLLSNEEKAFYQKNISQFNSQAGLLLISSDPLAYEVESLLELIDLKLESLPQEELTSTLVQFLLSWDKAPTAESFDNFQKVFEKNQRFVTETQGAILYLSDKVKSKKLKDYLFAKQSHFNSIISVDDPNILDPRIKSAMDILINGDEASALRIQSLLQGEEKLLKTYSQYIAHLIPQIKSPLSRRIILNLLRDIPIDGMAQMNILKLTDQNSEQKLSDEEIIEIMRFLDQQVLHPEVYKIFRIRFYQLDKKMQQKVRAGQ